MTKAAPPPRVAVLAPWLLDPYQRNVAAGAMDVARAAGAQILCTTGDGLDAGDPRAAARCSCFELLQRHPLDAVVAISASLAHDPSFLAPFLASFRGRTVSVGFEVAGFDSVVVDNEPGLLDLVLHLIDVHGRRRLAFILGPDKHPEAEARVRAFRRALELRGLAVDPELLVAGDFGEGSGSRAVAELWDGKRVPPDAVVATNDMVAHRVLETLRARGIRVPYDVSVTGYDDNPVALVASPPLATVRQPLRELGGAAMHLALDPAPGTRLLRLPTVAVLRASCGCLDASDQSLRDAQIDILSRKDTEDLLDAFERDLAKRGSSHLLDRARRIVLGHADRDRCCDAVLSLVVSLRGSPRARQVGVRADDVIHRVRDFLASVSRLSLIAQQHETDRRDTALREVNEPLIGAAGTQEQMLEAVLAPLDNLPFSGVAVVLRGQDRRSARLAAAYVRGGRRQVPSKREWYPDAQLLPQGMLPDDRPWERILSPLLFGREAAGFVLFDGRIEDHALMLSLQVELGAGLDRLAREKELEAAYAMLKANTERLIVAEKMASLVRMTAGLAHEMNTPLAAIRAAADELADLVEEYRTSITAAHASIEDHVAIGRDMTTSVEIISRSSERLAEFIRTIRGQVRDTGESRREAFDPREVVRDCLHELTKLAENGRCILEMGGDVEADLYGDRSRFATLTQALVENAIEATRPKGGGKLRVVVEPMGEHVEMRVIDCGVGIAKEHVRRVFDPMFSTKPFGEAAGMGLTVAHAIATVEYGGTIEIESRPGEGTTVIVRLPRRSPSVPAPPSA
jgi:DNA-binding LacI/PurR family transcriptional regulator